MHFHIKKKRVSDTEQAGEIEFLFFGSRSEKLEEKINKISRGMEAV